MTVFKWSTTAATNDDVDSTINWQEGQSPASVNNSARAMMAAIAKWRSDMSGLTSVGGTTTAMTFTSSQGFTALTDGLSFSAFMNVGSNGASPTMNVDGLGAKTIATVYGVAVGAGKLRGGAIYTFMYSGADDKWIVNGNPNSEFESGTKLLFRQTAAPVGWTKDTTYTNAALRVTSGTISQQATGGKEFSTLFASRTIAEANLPSHTHSWSGTTSSNGDHRHYSVANAGNGGDLSNDTDFMARFKNSASDSNYTLNGVTNEPTYCRTSNTGAHTHTVSGTTGGTGSGAALAFDVNFVDVIIATRD